MATPSFCGIDVAKERLDVVVLPEQQCSSVRNDAAGWAELVKQLRGFSIAAIGLEASGGYQRGVMRALLAADMPVHQINPFKLRQFAKASGVMAKSARGARGREAPALTRPNRSAISLQQRLGHDPFLGTIFVFRSKCADRLIRQAHERDSLDGS
jgi:transposase